MRHIAAQADFTDQPLAALKQWLAKTGTREDALLADLLAAATSLCERFTGITPLPVRYSERLPACADWRTLTGRPVRSVIAVAALAGDLAPRALAPGNYAIAPAADGSYLVRCTAPLGETLIEVTYEAGLAGSWDALEAPLREGIVRLAAHYYREREEAGRDAPPAAVAALWRPYRAVRL